LSADMKLVAEHPTPVQAPMPPSPRGQSVPSGTRVQSVATQKSPTHRRSRAQGAPASKGDPPVVLADPVVPPDEEPLVVVPDVPPDEPVPATSGAWGPEQANSPAAIGQATPRLLCVALPRMALLPPVGVGGASCHRFFGAVTRSRQSVVDDSSVPSDSE
jgi:hypothetical protein